MVALIAQGPVALYERPSLWVSLLILVAIAMLFYAGLFLCVGAIRLIWRHYHPKEEETMATMTVGGITYRFSGVGNGGSQHTTDASPTPDNPTPPADVPFEEGTVLTGYRAFQLEMYATERPTLIGQHATNGWLDGTFSAQCGFSDESAAQCLADPDWSKHKHGTGSPGCGVYSVRDLTTLDTAYPVYAAVVNFGIVVPGDTGFRAQHTRIEQLWMLHDDPNDWTETVAEHLSTRYGAPCDITTLEELWLTHGVDLKEQRAKQVAATVVSGPSGPQYVFQSQSAPLLSYPSVSLNVNLSQPGGVWMTNVYSGNTYETREAPSRPMSESMHSIWHHGEEEAG